MAKSGQISLKPQDVVVLFKLLLDQGGSFTYSALSRALSISASESHASVLRLKMSRLVYVEDSKPQVNRSSSIDFILKGARYAFPATVGGPSTGVPTGYAADPLASIINQSNDYPPVWPDSEGSVRGITLYPLYPSVPTATKLDTSLYEVLALFDAVRAGTTRERGIAEDMIIERCL